MKRSIAKRTVTVRTHQHVPGIGMEVTDVRTILAPHSWKRLDDYYCKYDTSQHMEHDPRLTARMVVVLGRKPRAGRKRR